MYRKFHVSWSGLFISFLTPPVCSRSHSQRGNEVTSWAVIGQNSDDPADTDGRMKLRSDGRRWDRVAVLRRVG